MENLIKTLDNAHSKIDSLIKGDPMKDLLKNLTGLQDTYQLGENKSLMFTNNLINSLVDSELNKNIKFEDIFNMSLGKSFGKNNNLNLLLSGGKDRAGLNLSYLFK
jgi:hypothetical protein